MEKEIIIALIGLVGIVVTAIIAPIVTEKYKKKKEETEKKEDLSLVIELQRFNEMRESLEELFQETKADRFLILIAKNGKDYLKFATAIYEEHKSGVAHISFGATSRYVNVEFDDEYRRMLKSCEKDGVFRMSVSEMPDCDLKGIYEAEQVKHSNCYFLKRIENTKDRHTVIYATLATHSDQKFERLRDEIPMKLFIDKIKSLFDKDEIHITRQKSDA